LPTFTFNSLQDAFIDGLHQVIDSPHYSIAPRGHRSKEVLAHSFRIANPLDRLIRISARRTNVVFNFAEFLWYVSGSREVDAIAYYAPRMRTYSPDGQYLYGTAYGPRLFGSSSAFPSQWERVLATLEDDPDTKRAILSIYESSETGAPRSADVACTLALQFLIRDDSLHAITYMRANDAYIGVVSDVFSFTMIQEMLARRLGVGVGSYTHFAGSYHVYEENLASARNVLSDSSRTDSSSKPCPPMPDGDPADALKVVLRWEQLLRRNESTLDAKSLARLPIDSYWQDILRLLELYRQIAHEKRCDIQMLDGLPDAYSDALLNRWPLHFRSRI